MRVSFVIPSLNQAAFIRRTIDGCLAQRLDDFEIIVRDGLSTDGTQDILASYGSAIRWSSERDVGQADAVNKGISLATGEIIAWINSDDYYTGPDVLLRVVDAFQSHPEADIVYGDGALVSAKGCVLREFPAQPIEPLKRILLHPVSFVLQPAVFFRKSLFEQVGGLDAAYHWALDYELWLRMFPAARRTVHIPAMLACGTVHAGAKSVHGMLKQFGETRRVKRRHLHRYSLSARDRWKIRWGYLRNSLYYAAVKTGAIRVA